MLEAAVVGFAASDFIEERLHGFERRRGRSWVRFVEV